MDVLCLVVCEVGLMREVVVRFVNGMGMCEMVNLVLVSDCFVKCDCFGKVDFNE